MPQGRSTHHFGSHPSLSGRCLFETKLPFAWLKRCVLAFVKRAPTVFSDMARLPQSSGGCRQTQAQRKIWVTTLSSARTGAGAMGTLERNWWAKCALVLELGDESQSSNNQILKSRSAWARPVSTRFAGGMATFIGLAEFADHSGGSGDPDHLGPHAGISSDCAWRRRARKVAAAGQKSAKRGILALQGSAKRHCTRSLSAPAPSDGYC